MAAQLPTLEALTMRRKYILVLVMLVGSVSPLRGQIDARMFRYPDVSERHIAFVYAGDIWIVEKEGGTAQRLSSPAGEESFPRFSPDGRRIAFSGNYDGNTDVYVIPVLGGEPVRVTYHPGTDRLVDWTPQGDALLFASRRHMGIRPNQLFRTSPAGGLPEKLPLAYGEFGALSPDGRWLAFTTKARGFRTWKRYRGGLAPDIWLFNLRTKQARNLTNSAANDAQPMWHNNKIYFLSDRGPSQRSNIWVVDRDGGNIRQITKFKDHDVTFPAIGPAEIVFQAGGRLYLLDLGTEQPREVPVEVVTDQATLRPATKNVSRLIQSSGISPSGKRAVFQARGDIFTLPAEHGVVRKLTNSSGVAERYPAWSPDGKYIAYWSDRTGDYELTLRSPGGKGEEETLTNLGPGYRYQLYWSPDSKKIAFLDHTQTIRFYDRDAKSLTTVDKALWMLHGNMQSYEVSWSSDSRWLSYHRGLETSNNAIFLFDTTNGSRRQVTSGYYSESHPVFDPDGKYLYYLSNRSLAPIYSDIDATWVYPNTTRIVAVPLRNDVPSPLAPRNDEEPVKKDKDAEEKKEGKEEGKEGAEEKESKDKKDKKPKEIKIDLEGFESRAVLLPPAAGNYRTLRAVSGKLLYQRLPRTGSAARQRPVLFFDFKEREEKSILDTARGYQMSADGKQLLVSVPNGWAIVKVAPKQKVKDRLPTGELESVVNPREEWRQIFTEVWRTYRDYFYDPSLHGLDWEALRDHYGSLLEDAVTRWDVTFVIGQLIGEVNASHTYVRGGDTETPARRQVGLLGIDWALENGAYRIARIVRGAPWDAETRSPLDEPGVKAGEGDYVLAVNGVPLDTNKDPFASFEGLARKTILLTLNDKPTLAGAREVLVRTLSSENRLRYLDWVEKNRRHVDEATGGRVGYIYVPNTGILGQTELVRQFNSQMRKGGLIIDERFNGGGQLPDRFIEQMNRRMVNRIYFRHGATATYPTYTHYGPKAMLINGWAGSGGDAFPYFFKELKVGPIIGERTWGGLIGPAVGHSTIDGGFFTAPPGRIFGPDGTWFAEGHGVDPDIPVVDDPGELARGTDPQLEAAIQEVLRLMKENPPKFIEAPPFERRVP